MWLCHRVEGFRSCIPRARFSKDKRPFWISSPGNFVVGRRSSVVGRNPLVIGDWPRVVGRTKLHHSRPPRSGDADSPNAKLYLSSLRFLGLADLLVWSQERKQNHIAYRA